MARWLEGQPLVITGGEGMYLIDSEGKRYLDGVSSLWCNVHGHRVAEIDAAIRRQLDKIAHSTLLGLASESAAVLAERLMRIVPGNLKKVFYSDCGAAATEIAFKMAAQYWHNIGRPDKHRFIGFTEAYHGDTFGAMSVGRTETFHKPYFPLLFETYYAPTPHAHLGREEPQVLKRRSLEALEGILREHHGQIAAICIEPIVQGAAGMLIQPEGFLKEVRGLADEYHVLLIADEVAVGFGRTGRMFACEHEDVKPDLMCVAKGISGGYLPLAATFATQEIFDSFLGEGRTFYHGHTYTGNALACAAAIASLELFEKNNLVEQVRSKGELFGKMLGELHELSHVGQVRHKGFMAGVELVEDKASGRAFDARRRVGAAVCERVRRHGVILRPLGDTVILMPPLAMEADDLRKMVGVLGEEIAAI